MGSFANFLSNNSSGLFNIGGSLIGGIFDSIQQSKNRKMQIAENQKDREFNAEQAELGRQFEEDMYKRYESPIAQAQQMRQAGLPAQASSQSVGSASTASAGSSALPSSPISPFNQLGDAVKQIPFLKQELRAAQLDNEQRELTAEKTRAETFKTWQEGYQTQIENGFTAEEKRAIIDNLKAEKEKKGSDKKLIDQQIQFIEDAKEAGINPVIDAHEESVARVNEIVNRIENDDARLENEELLTVANYLKTLAETEHINSLTEAHKIYRKYLQPLEVAIARNERDIGFSKRRILIKDEKLVDKQVRVAELEADAQELQNQLDNGTAQGFKKYLIRYVDTLIEALGIAANVTKRTVPKNSYQPRYTTVNNY